ncbi:OsmC family protein [Methylophaga pinxianii]|uniref:OsmC family protein n=1 Tax=Methylophaga pinxianii TaxID=2881052 RepID=UPI001CF30FB8|nr:OsmC family protein [Methylophaga pinxianii]MCB2426973.1 OsmC family protein [Methylophaga pinxianii]UPH44821.1 OsmC family protein [Methylophaga pinxianii]
MKARVKWVEDVLFVGESGTGHTIVMDGPEESGGHGTGMRPMELLLLGLGGCTSFDVIDILKKSRQDVTDCVVEVSAERSEEAPKVFTKIHVHYTVTGRNLKANFVDRAVKLSTEKYCSASIMLAKTAEITHDYEVIEQA